MKNKLVLLAVLCFVSLGFSQKTSKSKDLLDEVNQKITNYKNMYITFKYSLDNKAESIHQTTRGNITVMGDLYNVSYLGGIKIYDGIKTYTILPEDEEINISTEESEEEETLIKPSKFFSFYKTGFTYSWGALINMKGKKIQNIILTPTDSESEINSIILAIKIKNKEIYRMIENGKNGTITTLTINKFKKNLSNITKDLFTVDLAKYKKDGYIINEAQ